MRVTARDPDRVYDRFEMSLFARYDELQQRMIHRDAYPGNLLIQDGDVSSFIDGVVSVLGQMEMAILLAFGGHNVRKVRGWRWPQVLNLCSGWWRTRSRYPWPSGECLSIRSVDAMNRRSETVSGLPTLSLRGN